MWTVVRPTFDAGETFNACISRIQSADLRNRLRSVQPTVVAAAGEYALRAQNRTLNSIATSTTIDNVVTTDEMVKVYDQRMAKKGVPGRAIYDQLKLLPKDDRCPFCDQRNVSTLDHVLPKTLYPSFAVTPINLVGCCMECNKAKLAAAPLTPNDVVFHPYFDNITTSRWLTASVVQQNPCAIIFDITPPADWDAITQARAVGQFDLLGLSRLYSSEAAREISNIRHNLQTHFNAGGAEAVRLELTRQWHSRRANRLNSWQTALYEAVSHDEWFCSGGFG